MTKNYNFTKNMKTIFDENQNGLKSYYCREDFELALKDYDNAAADSKLFRFFDLKELCESKELDAHELIADRSILKEIPTRDELKDKLLDFFYEMYKKFPQNTDFMERTVRRLAPEYKNDTIRTAILKKFIKGDFKKYDTNGVIEWGKSRLSDDEKNSLDKKTDEERLDLILSKVNDSIFDEKAEGLSGGDIIMLIAGEMQRYKKSPDIKFESLEISGGLSDELDAILKTCGLESESGEAYDKVLRLAEGIKGEEISEEEIKNALSEFAEKLEKEFRKQLRKTERISKNRTESSSDELYKQKKRYAAGKAAGKAGGSKPNKDLLSLCDDLAKAKFRPNGKTKVYLYYFAFMFEMSLPLNGKKCEPEKNLETNLFQDYYNDNLLRCIELDNMDANERSSIESEPTGEGINYKSYVESIYIYFLCKDGLKMSPGEKIEEAEKLIEKCFSKAKKSRKDRPNDNNKQAYTRIYKESYINTLLEMEPDDIPNFVIDNYVVIPEGGKASARILAGAEQYTAKEIIDETMMDLDSCNFNIDFSEAIANSEKEEKKEFKRERTESSKIPFEWKLKGLLEQKFPDDKNFLKVVEGLDKRVREDSGRFSKDEKHRLIKLLNILIHKSSKESPLTYHIIKRELEDKLAVSEKIADSLKVLKKIGYDIQEQEITKVTETGERKETLYYLGSRSYENKTLQELLEKSKRRYMINISKEEALLTKLLIVGLKGNDRIKRSEFISIHTAYYAASLEEGLIENTLPDLYEDFKGAIDTNLEEARFQPISEKNIFDMYVVISLYIYMIDRRKQEAED